MEKFSKYQIKDQISQYFCHFQKLTFLKQGTAPCSELDQQNTIELNEQTSICLLANSE